MLYLSIGGEDGLNASISDEALAAILTIINQGNKAVVQRRGEDVIVMEEKRKIKYGNAPQPGGVKGNLSR